MVEKEAVMQMVKETKPHYNIPDRKSFTIFSVQFLFFLLQKYNYIVAHFLKKYSDLILRLYCPQI